MPPTPSARRVGYLGSTARSCWAGRPTPDSAGAPRDLRRRLKSAVLLQSGLGQVTALPKAANFSRICLFAAPPSIAGLPNRAARPDEAPRYRVVYLGRITTQSAHCRVLRSAPARPADPLFSRRHRGGTRQNVPRPGCRPRHRHTREGLLSRGRRHDGAVGGPRVGRGGRGPNREEREAPTRGVLAAWQRPAAASDAAEAQLCRRP